MKDNSATPEPSAAALRAALRKITERLARELAAPSDVMPVWSDEEWLIARAVAALHGVSPLLAVRLRWEGPSGWQRFLREQRAHTLKRHLRIQHLLSLIDAGAQEAGLSFVALKGAALHAAGLYAPGERPMADVDLLAREEEMPRAANLLESLGFHAGHATWKHRTFEPDQGHEPGVLGEHADNNITIELHDRIRERLPVNSIEVTSKLFPRQPRAGLNGYSSRAALLSHVLLHAAGAMCLRSIRMLHLHDIAGLAAGMSAADWQEFLEIGSERAGALWWAFPPLILTSRYYQSVPQRVVAAAELKCPAHLAHVVRVQTLTDVSFSNLRISAFPGIEWSQSVGEMLAYIKQRIVPEPDPLEAQGHATSLQPAPRETEWSQQTRARRVFLWIIGRPPRPDTLLAVRAAFAETL